MFIARLLFIALLTLGALDGRTAALEPYALANTEVHPLRSRLLQRDYRLFVSLPVDYDKQPARRYPVLFLTDTNYAFPLLRSIAHMARNQGRDLQDFILVGLSYADGDSPQVSRNRDYTPTARRNRSEDSASVYGQAEAYRRFIAEEVFPYVEKTLRADMGRKTFAGHSYGGLLGAHMLLTEPGMFQRYILSSPSLWYDDGLMLKRAQAFVGQQRELKARVLLLVGGLERGKDEDMVGDLRRFEATLKSVRLHGLKLESRILAGEGHLTAFPAAITRGLFWALRPGA